MDPSRQATRGTISNAEFENIRRNSDQPSSRGLSRSKSPLRNYKDNPSAVPNISYNQDQSYSAASFSKTQQLNISQQKIRTSSNVVTTTEPATKSYSKPGDILRKHEGYKRAGSMQVTNISDISKDVIYNFVPSASLQTIGNGNNAQNPLAQSYDKNMSSGTLTLASGNSGVASSASYCKNCKRLEEQEKILTYSLNQLLNQLSDVADKERLWRQGSISFEVDNFGWNNDDEQGIDPRLLKKSDSGRILLEAKKQFLNLRKVFEELIVDVENLSKTNPYMDIQLKQLKENRVPTLGDSSTSNPGRKLLSSIAEAKEFVDSLKSTLLSEEVPPEVRDQIKAKAKRESEEKNIMRTLYLQLEQSKRERRVLEVELSLQKKGILQNQNGINSTSLRQMIRQIIEEEISSKSKGESA